MRVVAAELEQHVLHVTQTVQHGERGAAPTREADLAHPGVAQQHARVLVAAGDGREHTPRQPRGEPAQRLGHRQRAPRRHLDHRGVAGDQRRSQLCCREHDRRVERHQQPDDAERTAPLGQPHPATLGHPLVEDRREGGTGRDHAGQPTDVGPSLRDDLAVLPGQEGRQLLDAHRAPQPLQGRAQRGDPLRGRRHRPARRSGGGVVDQARDGRRARQGDLTDDGAGASGVVDLQQVRPGRGGHVVRPLSAGPRRRRPRGSGR